MKKSLGQHFLKSEKVLDKILEISGVDEGDTIFEIGPGAGALTKKLIDKKAHIICVEKDDNLTKIISDQVTWHQGDVLAFDFASLPYCKAVANIPYYLSSQILQLLLDHNEKFSSITLLVQKEFAEKILAQESFLSLLTHLFYEPMIALEVGRHHFYPPPKVTSAVLHLKKVIRDVDQKGFQEFAKIITQSKRKMLKTLCPEIGFAIKEMGLSQTLRLGEIGFDDLIHLYNKMKMSATKPDKSQI
ncbi:MAG: ribosomal RNA small subunit methyltransferase A [Chlamydiae bacterium]|nr:ribosomal RNA small subunit methyltransferase A [Chlamydiota bacterium]